MRDGPAVTHRLCGVSAKVRALCSTDLDAHAAFIRRSLANGDSVVKIAGALGITSDRVDYFARKRRMVRNRRRSLHHPHHPGDGPIA